MVDRSSLYVTMAWRLFLDVASRGAFFIVNIVIARALGVAEFGKFAYAASLVQIFYGMTEFGIHLQLAKELGEKSSERLVVWKHFFELKILLLAACLIVAVPISISLWHWSGAWIPVAALVWMFSNSMLDFNQFTCNGLGRMDIAQNMMMLQRGIVVASSLGALAVSRTLESVMIGMAAGGVTGMIAANVYFFKTTGVRAGWDGNRLEWKRILVRSVPIGVASLLGQTWVRIGPVLLAWVWTSQIVGEYSAAFRIFEFTYIVPASVMAISVPHLAESLDKGLKNFLGQIARVASIMVPLAIIWPLFLYFGSGVIVRALFGVKFLNAIPVLKVLAGVSALVFLNYTVTHLLVVVNRQKRHALNMALSALLGVCFFALLVGRGAPATAGAFLLTELCLFLFTLRSLWAWWREQKTRS